MSASGLLLGEGGLRPVSVKAFFVDFYGTVVHEDGEVISSIVRTIAETGKAGDASAIGSYWWKEFQSLLAASFGAAFETQRALEKKSLERTLRRFGSYADAGALSEMLFAHWVKPPIFEDSMDFFHRSPLPVFVVSNIDTADLLQALAFHQLRPAGVFTSEAARSYKPRRELFEMALRETGLKADEVIHIGDSISSDMRGAANAGIPALWLNRSGKPVPAGVKSITSLAEALSAV